MPPIHTPNAIFSVSNPGVRLGGAEVQEADELMNSAISVAAAADAVIAVVGLNADWETEGYDRTTLALPGRTDELVQKVLAANPRTVVVTQSVRSYTFFLLKTLFYVISTINFLGRSCYASMGR